MSEDESNVEDLYKPDPLPLEIESTSNVSGSGFDVETSVLDEILSVESGNSTSALIEGSGNSGQQQKEVAILNISLTGALMKSKNGPEPLKCIYPYTLAS